MVSRPVDQSLVYVQQVRLSCFKSFGGRVEVALKPGFTVITGPNGSGKSNIIDGILFCLGLASSRGMRAERLPDLINHGLVRQGKAAEASVSVVFSLKDWQPPEVGPDNQQTGPWIDPSLEQVVISRRIRLAPGGTYSSIYSIGQDVCSLSQLQTQLRRLRIDPTGSNVVMQGDVTRIVSMGGRERREIIDELAGVALFDQRIEQCRAKLTTVQEHGEHCRILEAELGSNVQRLERDCQKARRYQQLRHQLQRSRQQELLLLWELSRQQYEDLLVHQQKHQQEGQVLLAKREQLTQEHHGKAQQLQELQAQVKALGEGELLAVQAKLAGLQSRERELQRNLQNQDPARLEQRHHDWRGRHGQLQAAAARLASIDHGPQLEAMEVHCADTEQMVDHQRKQLGELADRSGSWLETYQSQQQAMAALRTSMQPMVKEQLQLQEQLKRDEEQLQDSRERHQQAEVNHRQSQAKLDELIGQKEKLHQLLATLQTECKQNSSTLKLVQGSRQRLEQGQAKLEQDLARAESRQQVLQESHGTAALRLILESDIPGIHGPVAQLGTVEPPYRLALDVAAGARLNHVVVEDDHIASQAIALLKRHGAGRLTFLPLNRLRPSAGRSAMARGQLQLAGLVNRAVALVHFEPIYQQVFAHVLGETLVFERLSQARRLLGQHRCVTMEGELLERSGAMTGGGLKGRQNRLSFSWREQVDEVEPLRQQLLALAEKLSTCRQEEISQSTAVDAAQERHRDTSCHLAAVAAQYSSLQAQHRPLGISLRQQHQHITATAKRIKERRSRLHLLDQKLTEQQEQLALLEAATEDGPTQVVAGQWHQLQLDLKAAEAKHNANVARRDALRSALGEHQVRKQSLAHERQLLEQEGERLEREHQAMAQRHQELTAEQQQLEVERQTLESQYQKLHHALAQQRQQRDGLEADVGQLNQQLHQNTWLHQQWQDKHQSLKDQQVALEKQIGLQQENLPDPRPELPHELRTAGLAALQQQIRGLERHVEALEPVNMLALEELEALKTRLSTIAERLAVLDHEREGVLQRIEMVASLRKKAFMEAFTAVNGHFQQIFAELSDGEGHLQLEDEGDPLAGGLTLVAHPKGKILRRLSAMSGGEKSLTALSFLFALQRFRPSPFYALDEVDSFLDGVNVDNLARLIGRQAQLAQFLVVSHRRPMIAAAQRAIGVTQARGAHTQVIGLPTQVV